MDMLGEEYQSMIFTWICDIKVAMCLPPPA